MAEKRKGKAPALQFYTGDWFKDSALRQATVTTRGIWIDILLFMWGSDQRGLIETTPLRLMRLTGATEDEVMHFLNEIYELEFGTMEIDENIQFPTNNISCNENVTLINRRMYSDYKDRQNTRLRVQKWRRNKNVTAKKQKCNTNVTVTSSTSTSTSVNSLSKDKQPKGRHFSNFSGKYFEPLLKNCRGILVLPSKNGGRPFNPFEFVQKCINDGKHPGAINEVLEILINRWSSIEKGPYNYATTILKTTDGNWHERDRIVDHEAFKKEFAEWVDANDLINKITQQIGRE